MNKRIILATALVVVVILGLIYYKYLSTTNQNNVQNNTNPITNTTTSSIKVPISDSIFNGGGPFKNITDTSTGNVISFQLHGGPKLQGVNPVFDVLVNGKITQTIQPTGKPSEYVAGYSISMIQFSPDNKYLAFRTKINTSAGSQETQLYVVDLGKLSTFQLFPYTFQEAATNPDNRQYQDINNFISSYSWGNSNDILVTMYAVGNDKTGLYRITPQETWDFNLVTGTSTLEL